MNQAETADALRNERERLVAYLETLPEAAWDKPTLCADWSVRDLVAHLVGNAADINALRLEGMGDADFNQRQVDERGGKTTKDLLTEWADEGPRFEQGVRDQADDFWTSPYPPFGTVSTAIERLVEDLWVHAQDIRLALGDEPDIGPGLESTLAVVARELPERARRLAPGIASVDLDAGTFKRSVALDGSGEALRISGDAVTLALTGTGRFTLAKAAADGKLSVKPEAPSGFADALNIYGP